MNSKPEITPWNGKELRQFWAMARTAGMNKDAVHCLIGKMFEGKGALHDLTRGEFIRLMKDVAMKQAGIAGDLDRHFIGKPVYPSWLRIRWLQRQIGWSDGQLVNYIKKHGRASMERGRSCPDALSGRNIPAVHAIDHISWLTVNKAHGIITGLEKIRHAGRVYGLSQRQE